MQSFSLAVRLSSGANAETDPIGQSAKQTRWLNLMTLACVYNSLARAELGGVELLDGQASRIHAHCPCSVQCSLFSCLFEIRT